MADGHTGALFLLSETVMELALSWGCLDMKMKMKMGGVAASWASKKCFSASCVPFQENEQNTNGELDDDLPSAARGCLGSSSGSLGT